MASSCASARLAKEPRRHKFWPGRPAPCGQTEPRRGMRNSRRPGALLDACRGKAGPAAGCMRAVVPPAAGARNPPCPSERRTRHLKRRRRGAGADQTDQRVHRGDRGFRARARLSALFVPLFLTARNEREIEAGDDRPGGFRSPESTGLVAPRRRRQAGRRLAWSAAGSS